MELLIVHLTDIHIRDDADFEILSERIDSMGGAICTHITEPEKTEILFCVTGDFAFEGLEEQYDAIGMILEEICSLIRSRFPGVGIHPVFVPGNHDCDFNSADEKVRAALLMSPALDIKQLEHVKICTSIQNNFFKFGEEWKQKYGAMYCENDKILTINELNFTEENIHIKFHCINTSWCSKKIEEKGKMKITTGKMKLITDFLSEKKRDDIVITMMHHSAEWLDWEDYNIWNEYHKKYSDIILVGHEHRTECVRKENYDKTTNEFIMGNQLFDKNSPNQSGFNLLKIKTDSSPMQECFFTYEWDGNLYTKEIDTGYHPFVRNRFVGSGIELREDVLKYIEDIGFDIINKSKRELKLSDVYGFPTLREERDKGIRFIRDMSNLIQYFEEKKFVFIRGQKEYGKTALLKQIFKEYYSRNKFPVFLDITQINTADGEELNRIIEKKYVNTYENISADKIMQKAQEEKVCLIDNFEEIQLTDKTAKKFLQYLTNKFGIVIISKNHTLDLINPVSYVEMNDFVKSSFSVLVIQAARKSYMDRIISKWLCSDNELEKNTPQFDAKRKLKYSEIATVMKGNYFNGTPIDLLLVLSYLDQEQPTQIDYSRYSFIYDSMILSKLNKVGDNKAQIISAYKKILENIAYKMYEDEIQGYVNEYYIYSVINDYKERHSGFNKKAGDIVQRLIDCSFLECKNDKYKFKYGYMYYYFIGSHIEKIFLEKKGKKLLRIFFLI